MSSVVSLRDKRRAARKPEAMYAEQPAQSSAGNVQTPAPATHYPQRGAKRASGFAFHRQEPSSDEAEEKSTDPEYEAVNGAFDRALVFLHKMPRIWLHYI